MLYALSFLTAIPVKIKKYTDEKAARTLYYFVSTGALLGIINALALILLLNTSLGRETIAVVIIVLNTALTGGLHMDGVADLFDSFGAHDREKKLEIMKDSRTGTFGVLSLICLLALKTVFLMECMKKNMGMPALISAAVTARFVMVWLIRIFPAARKKGFAAHFKGLINKRALTFNSLVFAGILILLRPDISLLYLTIPVVIIILVISSGLSHNFKGLTGDVYGAMCELTELLMLTTWGILG